MKRLVFIAVVWSLAGMPALASTPRVEVPKVAWADLLPYLEANLRVDYAAGRVIIGASTAEYERKLFEPYEPALGELATVLIVEGLNERGVHRAIADANRAIKGSGLDPASAGREELIARYWKELSSDERFVSSLRKLYRKAMTKGSLRCTICEEGFTPRRLELR